MLMPKYGPKVHAFPNIQKPTEAGKPAPNSAGLTQISSPHFFSTQPSYFLSSCSSSPIAPSLQSCMLLLCQNKRCVHFDLATLAPNAHLALVARPGLGRQLTHRRKQLSPIPASTSDVCEVCNHGWITHEGDSCVDPAHPNYAFRRGSIPSHCGGFHSDLLRWDFQTLCICLSFWMIHHPIPLTNSQNSVEPPGRPASHIATLSTTAPSLSLSLNPPINAFNTVFQGTTPSITAFQGIPPVAGGTVASRRTASALRTLPHNQGGASLAHRGPRRAFPSGPSPFNVNPTVVVAVFPMVIPGIHEPAGYPTTILKARNDDMLPILERLRLHGLIVTITVPRSGPTPPVEFTAQVSAALEGRGIFLPPCPTALTSAEATQFTKQPWALLSSTRRADVLTFRPHPSINTNNFGFAEFAKLGKKFPNPDPDAGVGSVLVLICKSSPRFGGALGSIDSAEFNSQDLPDAGLSLSHSCFPFRVIDGLPFAGSTMLVDPHCLDGLCPGEPIAPWIPPPTIPSMSLVRPRSSSESSPSLGRHVRRRRSSVDIPFVEVPLSLPSSLLPSTGLLPLLQSENPALRPPALSTPPPKYPVQNHTDVPALVPGADIAPLETFADFQSTFRLEAGRPIIPFTSRLSIHAHTVDDAAKFLVPLLTFLHQHPDRDDTEPFLEFPSGVISCTPIRSVHSFFKTGRSIRLGVRSGSVEVTEVSLGPGPERAVYRRAIELMAEDHNLWQQGAHSRYMIPVLTPGAVNVVDRRLAFQAHGSLLALHCYILSSGPVPISIWLLLALCLGEKAMLLPNLNRYIAALDPVAYDCLAPWFALKADDIIPNDIMHPFNQFLINIMDMQPSMIRSSHTQDIRDGWTITFLSAVLLGNTGIWSHPEFLTIKSGFDLQVGRKQFIAELSQHGDLLPLLTCIFDHNLREVKDVTSRFSFPILMRAADETTPYFGALLRLFILRYLDGVGHPIDLRGGLVSEEEWSCQVNNHLLRASLLLRAVSDNDMLPASNTWRIVWRIIGLNPPGASSWATAETNPRPLHFHTCTYEIDVKITRPLEDLLLASRFKLDDPNYVTPFDCWLHGQLLSRDHNTASDSEGGDEDHDDLLLDLQAGLEAEALQHMSDGIDSMTQEEDAAETLYYSSRSPSPLGDVFSNRGREHLSSQRVRHMLDELSASVRRDEEDEEELVSENLGTVTSVDPGEGSIQERADLLVTHILSLQVRPSSPPMAVISPIRYSPGPPRMPVLFSPPVGASGIRMVTGIQTLHQPLSLYFIGIQTLSRCRVFCEPRSFMDPDPNDGALFRRLRLANGPAARALLAIGDPSAFFVGTSDYPIDIAQDYANHQFHFREFGSLLDVENGPESELLFFPVPDSAARSALIHSQRMTEETPVYVVYIYHQDAEPLRGIVPGTLLPTAQISFPILPASGSATAVLPVFPPPPMDVHVYLLTRFAIEYTDLARWRTRSYGSAYNHCLTERQVLRICQSLGIGLLGRYHSPAIVESMTIRMEDVVAAAGVNFQTFSTYRTELRLIKEAHVILRRHHRAGTLAPVHQPLLDMLEVMLSDRVLPADAVTPLQDSLPTAEAEFSAVRMTISNLMTQVRFIIDTLSNT
ncbi:hypothetical protein B0H19DRAFT_1270875 [Mycena capillaripes]|nr:hypothetical protein B0H19DRAFT_1270875 [Mycena capillaripes]